MYDSWTALEFPEVKQSILGKFSHDVSEPVANLLIRELVESVDRPGTASGIKLENEPELEWVMPVINYAFSLSFISPREYETIKAAIRIYLSWMTSITPEVQKSCPSSLIEHPDRYFRRMIEALRLIFLPRHIPYTVDADVIIDRQANEIRTVLSSIKLWTSKVHDDYRDEVWSRSLLFLIAVNEQLLTIPSTPDDIGPSVAPDLVQSLLDCWIHAALHELIPSPSYWKTLTLCSRRWVFHVPLIEIWSKKLLSLTILLVQKIHGNTENLKNISIDNIYLQEDIQNFDNLKETWLRLFHLLGNPAQFLLYSNRFIDNAQVDTNLLAYINGQISLSFFLAITAICKMIEIFYGNTQISTDFHEIDDLYHIWLDACKVVQDEWNRSYNRQRPSNMSSGSSGISGMNTLSTGIPAGDASTLTHQSLAASNSALAAGPSSTTISRKNTANFTHSLGSTKGQKITQSARTSQYTPQVPPEPVELPRLRPGQYVWYYLKNNKLTPLTKHENQPKVAHMMEIFLYWLYDPALSTLNPLYKKYSEDVISQRSMSSAEIDMQSVGMSGGVLGGLASPSDSGVTRHSFAQSTTSSSDISSPQNSHIPSNVFEYPSVDGVAAGRAAALGALCRIICAKSSREQLPDDQLAQFYTVMHEALIERDRLMLCSLLYYSVDLFKLGLRGIEILLPNYLMAIDVILTESMKLRLHPSIHEVEMRHACLRALASIIAWPTTFGPTSINDNNSRLNQGPGNVLEINPTYIEMRPRILRNLVYTLRHETDSTNLHLALSLCAIFCEECCRYDLSMAKSNVLQEKKVLQRQKASLDGDSPTDDDEEKYYAVSVLRGIVSAICDNLCKTQWNSETITSLAALDCLNVMATLPQSIVFSNREMSTGSLIVTSLCRFVDTQLQKPPPFHSRDLHSSVVAAYSSIQIWLCSAPMLTEIDACLTTVAQTIEFGLTGGKNMSPSEYKPASQRVYDAAELLLSTLFSVVGGNNPSTIIDERRLLYKYSPQNIDTTKFRHFLVRQHSLISIHEATHIDEISHGYPTLFMITRTPYHQAHTSIIQLRPKSFEAKDGDQENMQIFDVPSPGALAMTGVGEILNSISTAVQQKQSLRRASPPNESKSLDNLTSATGSMGTQKQFEFPPGFDKPQCKLDAAFPPLQPIPETDQIITQLSQIKNRLSQGGGSAIGQRDAHNVWIQSSLGSFLSQPPRPQSSVKKCNTGRIFLYDLGLINGNSFNKELIPLDSGQCDEFYRDLHQIVDRSATKILQTVGIFYVKDGQRTVGDILDNAMAIPTTRPEFCRFLAELGEGVDIATHPNWTGHWATAFSAERKPLEKPRKQDNYALDGINHCLWWSDSLHEIAYVMFSERSAKLSHLLAGGNGVDTQHLSSYTRGSSREMTLGEEDIARRGSVVPQSVTNHDQNMPTSISSDLSQQNILMTPAANAQNAKSRTKSTSTINSENSGPQQRASSLSYHSHQDKPAKRNPDQRIFVVWLERIEDMYHFPYEDGSRHTSQKPDFVIIFLHNFEPGLVRVHIEGIWTKYSQPGPLVDGMVISTTALSTMVRQTIISIARRRLIEVDQYQMVHLKRRNSIQDFAKKYTQTIQYRDFLDKFITL
uniref:Ral GTPase-activating protein subunit alpha/beta N-terminal domain-containing protein n=1 Tax=Acrobeloides nanus TaxID=290746 RepID=A0A914CZF2_9BILA